MNTPRTNTPLTAHELAHQLLALPNSLIEFDDHEGCPRCVISAQVNQELLDLYGITCISLTLE